MVRMRCGRPFFEVVTGEKRGKRKNEKGTKKEEVKRKKKNKWKNGKKENG